MALYTYVGVYLKLTSKMEIDTYARKQCAVNPEHTQGRITHVSKYCHVCGAELINQTKREPLHYSDLVEEMDPDSKLITDDEQIRLEENFTRFGYDGMENNISLLTPEHKSIFGQHFDGEEGEYEINSPGTTDLAHVSDLLAEDINLLSKFFDVEVKFGYLAQWS